MISSNPPPSPTTTDHRRPELLLFRNLDQVAGYDLPGLDEVVKIGSHENSTMRLQGEGVARLHAVIEGLGSSTWKVIDLGSPYGTKVNGQPIKILKIGPNDQIEIGEYTIKIVMDAATAPADKHDLATRLQMGADRILELSNPAERRKTATLMREAAEAIGWKSKESTWGAMELHALEAIEREKRMWVTAMEAIDAQAVAFSNNPNVHAALAQVRAAVTISLGESMRMTMIGAIKIAARTGAALRPAGKASLYYLLSPQPGLHVAPGEPVTLEQSHLCLPSRHGAVPASPDVADMLGPWEVIPVEQAQRERAAVVEQGEVLQ